MKKLFFFIALFATTLSLSAQRKMQVWEGNLYTEFTTAAIDSVTFLYSPIGTPKPPVVVHDTIIQNVIKEVHDTVYIDTCQKDDDSDVLMGVFSVSANKQVRFSKGNLQCTLSSTDTIWSFAENQYDIIGTANVTGGTESYDATYGYSMVGNALANKIDIFGWSANNTTAPWGISISNYPSDYAGDFVDWGTNTIGTNAPNTYRTLTYEEWDYLINTRTNASNLIGVARIQLSNTEYANGLILLPDSWNCPADITFKGGFANDGGIEAYATYQTFSLTQWQHLEAAGAVLLPASGTACPYRLGVEYVQCIGYYWSATAFHDPNLAHYFSFGVRGASTSFILCDIGQTVRLVQDVK